MGLGRRFRKALGWKHEHLSSAVPRTCGKKLGLGAAAPAFILRSWRKEEPLGTPSSYSVHSESVRDPLSKNKMDGS